MPPFSIGPDAFRIIRLARSVSHSTVVLRNERNGGTLAFVEEEWVRHTPIARASACQDALQRVQPQRETDPE